MSERDDVSAEVAISRAARIAGRWGALKSKNAQMLNYLSEIDDAVAKAARRKLDSCAAEVRTIANIENGKGRIRQAKTCDQWHLCCICAERRSAKYRAETDRRVWSLSDSLALLTPVLITLTVRDREVLTDALDGLVEGYNTLKTRCRTRRATGRGRAELAKLTGGVVSYEVSRGAGGLWHPHLHIGGWVDSYIDEDALSSEWKGVSGSDQVSARHHDDALGFSRWESWEAISRYLTKPADRPPAESWEIYRTLGRKRLMERFGTLRGIQTTREKMQPIGPGYVVGEYQFSDGRMMLDLEESERVTMILNRLGGL